jgi:hypothetical protein
MDQAADDQRVRPIVAGTVFLKFILKGALADPTGQRVLKVLSKHNKALGTSGGPEMAVFESSAQYESGAAISTTDMTNAFNEFDREHLFESITELWPESFCLWAFIYGIDSLIFFQYYDQSTGRLIFMFIWCEVGSKMGCTWGSIAIGLVLHLFVYGPLDAEFASHEAISITDDSFAFLRPSPNESGWQEAYRMHATYIERFTELANVVGLDFNWSKAWLLLPAGAPRPDADAGLPGGLQITWSGIVVAGAPVGTVAFKQQHATAFFDGLSYRINALVKLGTSDEEEQIAFRLLGLCLVLSPTYYLRVVPPSITAGPAAIFDQRMATARMDILGGLSDADAPCPASSAPTTLPVLPRRHGGLGHTRAQDLAPFAYLGGLALASKLQQFASKVVYLRPVHHTRAWHGLAALGGADRRGRSPGGASALRRRLPRGPARLVHQPPTSPPRSRQRI